MTQVRHVSVSRILPAPQIEVKLVARGSFRHSRVLVDRPLLASQTLDLRPDLRDHTVVVQEDHSLAPTIKGRAQQPTRVLLPAKQQRGRSVSVWSLAALSPEVA